MGRLPLRSMRCDPALIIFERGAGAHAHISPCSHTCTVSDGNKACTSSSSNVGVSVQAGPRAMLAAATVLVVVGRAGRGGLLVLVAVVEAGVAVRLHVAPARRRAGHFLARRVRHQCCSDALQGPRRKTRRTGALLALQQVLHAAQAQSSESHRHASVLVSATLGEGPSPPIHRNTKASWSLARSYPR